MSNEPAPTNPNEEPTAASLLAFDLCAKQAGLNAESMDVWGEHNWHTNLMAVLSVGVAKLMKRQQLEAVVAQRLPNYSQTDDCQKLIAYFYEKYDADKGFMNANLREINAKAQETIQYSKFKIQNEEEELDEEENDSSPLANRATGAFRVVTECHYGPTKGSESPLATVGRVGGES